MEKHFITGNEYIILHAGAHFLSGIRNRRRTSLYFLLAIHLLSNRTLHLHILRRPSPSQTAPSTHNHYIFDHLRLQGLPFYSHVTDVSPKATSFRSFISCTNKKKRSQRTNGRSIVFFGYFSTRKGGFSICFTKAYTIFAISGVRRGLGDKGGILGIFSPALASIERTNIVGCLLLDFHTANIAYASNHESAGGDCFFHGF